jgi:hypothetical protein
MIKPIGLTTGLAGLTTAFFAGRLERLIFFTGDFFIRALSVAQMDQSRRPILGGRKTHNGPNGPELEGFGFHLGVSGPRGVWAWARMIRGFLG